MDELLTEYLILKYGCCPIKANNTSFIYENATVQTTLPAGTKNVEVMHSNGETKNFKVD